jgi:hypothetical protein
MHTGLLYRFGFRRLHTAGSASPSLNSQWAPLSIYHNNLLPNKEVCIVQVPHRPTVVTYLDVLHKPTLRLYSFIHIPDIPVAANNSFTPFPVLENERGFTTQAIVGSERFDIARAVDTDIGRRVVDEFIDTLVESSPDTMLPLQGTHDGYYWKDPRHWLTVESRLKQFHEEDHIYVLADVVLQIRNLVQASFCAMAERTATICEVFFRAAVSSSCRNVRTLPVLSLADMRAVVTDANNSLTVKAFMCASVACKEEHEDGFTNCDGKGFHPLATLVSDPWLLFAIRTFVPRDSSLFAILQNSKRIEPIERAVVFTVRQKFMEGPTMEYVQLWTDTPVDVTTEGYGQEGIPVITITSPIVAQMDNDGTLGRNMEESGGMSSTHGQSQHTTTILFKGDSAYTYDDTLPFLIKVCEWDKDNLGGRLNKPIHTLQSLLADSHSIRDEHATEEVL